MKKTEGRSTVAAIYDDKPASYFANARHDIVAALPTGPDSSVLELGCGAGGTGRAVLAAGKAGRYVGLELNDAAAAIAAEHLTQVLVGDVEALDLAPYAGTFDALIISEVLEHLTDPWTTLSKLVACVKPGGAVFASSPNISHWRVIRELALGRFDYAPTGIMDRTHLRWFTPATYKALFEQVGVEVLAVGPLVPITWKARMINGLTGDRFSHLFMPQITVAGRRRKL